MAITSYPLLRFFFYSFLLIVTLSQCPPNLRLPMLYQYNIKLPMMRGGANAINKNNYAFYYLVNYPLQLISKASPSNINALISVQKQQTNQFSTTLNYRVKHLLSTTNVVVSAQSYNFSWKTLEISILLFYKQSYPSLTSGSIVVVNSQSRRSLSTAVKLAYPYKQNFAQSLIFINGINMTHTKNLDYDFEVSVIQTINFVTGQLVVNIDVGSNAQLVQLYLSYIVYTLGESAYEISGNYVILSDLGIGQNDYYLGNSISSSTYYIFGVSSFKFKKGPGEFSLALSNKQNSQNFLGINISLPFFNLNVAVFRIGNNANKICNNCPQSYIQNIASTTVCVASCEVGSPFNNPINQAKECLICSAQLNFGFVNGKCQCLNGYKNINGRCIQMAADQASIIVNTTAAVTLSRRNSDCLEENTYRHQNGSCVCKPGYSRKNVFNLNICSPICSGGYFNGQSCTACSPGTYPWNELKTCLPCSRFCMNCQSQYACQQCGSGFYLTSQGQCKQICGDGIKIYDQCDDGNTQDGDGCSSICRKQHGFNCNQQDGKKSVCTLIDYQIRRGQMRFLSGNIIVEYQMSPAPTKFYSPSQLQQIILLRFFASPPYQTYLTQNPNNPSLFRFVASYGGNAPMTPAVIQITFKLPNGKTFQDQITQDFIPKGGRINSRSLNGPNDKLS